MVVLIVIILAISTLIFYNNYWKRRNLPPGPIPWPLLGNRHTLTASDHWPDIFVKWKQQYGKIYTYWLGGIPVIAVADYELANKIFVKNGENFTDRMTFGELDDLIRDGSYGLLFTGGDSAREHRRFGLRVFRDFGVGKSRIQEKIIEETILLLEKVDELCGQPNIDLVPLTDIAVGSIINTLMFGYRFTEDGKETEFYRMKQQQTDIDRSALNPVVALWAAFPKLYKVPFFDKHCQAVIDNFRKMLDMMQDKIDEHKQRIEREGCSEPQDYVDAYLMERARREANGEDTSFYSDLQLKSVCFDFWTAGQGTTSSTITWAIALLIHNPQVQDRVAEELDRVIGSDRIISMADKNDLSFVNAVINEIQRRTNLIAENLFRTASTDCVVEGYPIKKGQVVLPQISVFLEDPEVFPDPKAFRPERFIDENGQLLKFDEFQPFGMGKRSCLGESLARTELFLFLANLMNRFRFLPGDELPVLKKFESGAAFPITPYKCRVTKRKTN